VRFITKTRASSGIGLVNKKGN